MMATAKVKTEKQATGEAEGSRPIWGAILLLALITAAVYARVTRQDFVHWDDKGHVVDNPYLYRLDSANLLHFWTHPYEHLYIPLSYMAFALLSSIARMPHHNLSVTVIDTLLNPHVFHTANLVLHVANTLIVFAILRRAPLPQPLSPPGKGEQDTNSSSKTLTSVWPAFFGALIFAVHPLQVESVAWISELRGQLSSIFCLGTVYLYITTAQSTPDDRLWSRPVYWIALALTVLGLLCKPSIITIGLLLIVIDRWLLGRPWRTCLISASPWLILAIPFLVITHHAQPVSTEGSGAIWQRPFIAGDALAFYLGKLFVPVNLAIEYGRRPDAVMAHCWGYATWLAPAAVAVVVFHLRKGRPWLVAGTLISIAMLLPVLGLVPFAYQSYSTVADRYVYLAMLGPALIVASMVRDAEGRGRGRIAIGVTLAVIAVLGAVTVIQVRYWDNSVTLFRHAVAINPNSYGVRTNYGISLDNLGRYDAAIAQYREAERIQPDSAIAYQDMGTSLLHEGKPDEALGCFRQAVELAPDLPIGHAAIGLMLMSQNRPADALPELELAAKLAPFDSVNRAHLAGCLQQLGRVDDARDQFDQALAVDPSNVTSLTGLAVLDVASGKLDSAESESRRAIALEPSNPAPHATLGEVLQDQGNVDEAIAQYRQASTLDPSSGALHFTLGTALFKSGDHAAAIPELQAAARLSPTAAHIDVLGIAYAATNDMAGARRQFEQALQVDPQYAPARKHIAMLSSH